MNGKKHRAARCKSSIAVAAGLALLAACGSYSNEELLDALYLRAVPRASEVALQVDGGDQSGQALTESLGLGQPAKLYTDASATARGINQGVALLLNFVQDLGRVGPPTRRSENRRVWGPVANVNGSGITWRLEIRREEVDDKIHFAFCLHAARDREAGREQPSCGGAPVQGYRLLLSGWYSPQFDAAVEGEGAGALTLDLAASKQLGLGDANTKPGVLDVAFALSEAGTHKKLEVHWEPALTSGQGAMSYAFERTASGEVNFLFQIDADMVGGGVANPTSTALETLAIKACWGRGDPGRGEGTVGGGDIEPGKEATIAECWNALHLRTYYRLDVPQAPSLNELEGDPTSCRAPCGDFPPAGWLQ